MMKNTSRRACHVHSRYAYLPASAPSTSATNATPGLSTKPMRPAMIRIAATKVHQLPDANPLEARLRSHDRRPCLRPKRVVRAPELLLARVLEMLHACLFLLPGWFLPDSDVSPSDGHCSGHRRIRNHVHR